MKDFLKPPSNVVVRHCLSPSTLEQASRVTAPASAVAGRSRRPLFDPSFERARHVKTDEAGRQTLVEPQNPAGGGFRFGAPATATQHAIAATTVPRAVPPSIPTDSPQPGRTDRRRWSRRSRPGMFSFRVPVAESATSSFSPVGFRGGRRGCIVQRRAQRRQTLLRQLTEHTVREPLEVRLELGNARTATTSDDTPRIALISLKPDVSRGRRPLTEARLSDPAVQLRSILHQSSVLATRNR